MALGGLRVPAPQTLPGHRAVAFHLVLDHARLDRRQHRLAFGDTQPQRGGGDPVIAVDGHDFVLDPLSRLDFRHQRDCPAHRCSFRAAKPLLRIPRRPSALGGRGAPLKCMLSPVEGPAASCAA
jgi:hypothetical protein